MSARRLPRGRDAPQRPRSIVRLAAYFGLLALAGFFVYIGVAAIHDRGQPVTWGTLTVEHREAGRGHGHVRGSWSSDDGRITVRNVDLDGSAGSDHTVRAYLRPGSWLGGDTTVHDGRTDWLDFVFAPVFFVLTLGFIGGSLWLWDDLSTLSNRIMRR